MFSKINTTSKRVYFDKEVNVMIGVFDCRNARNVRYGSVSITALKGRYKEQISVSIPELKRIALLIDRMPKIKIKQNKK